MAEWIYPLAGGGLLALLVYDVFQTAFHAEGRGGPINRRQNRLIWRVVRWAGTTTGKTRPGILSLGGPVMAVTTICVWSALLLLGFTLIYMPWVLEFHFSPGQPGTAVLEAFYYSGIITATIGQGDVVARDAPLRIVTIVQGLSGFALVTVAVSYVLAIYREVIAAHTLATAIHARLEARSAIASRGTDEDADWARSITFRLAHVLESHFNYPILHYFRPRQSKRALPPQLARLLEEGGPLTAGADAQAEGPDGSSSAAALRAMVRRYVGEVHSLFVQQTAEPDEEPDRVEARLRQILDMLAYGHPGG